MNKYLDIANETYSGYANYLWNDITHPSTKSFFWWVVVFSLFFFALEMIKPWRKQQARFRKDFWLDLFYVFFNFFIFGLVFWSATQNVLVEMFNSVLAYFGVENIIMLQLDKLPVWAYFIILFVVADFLSWWVHRMLHWVPFMWRWHKVHHSVEQMGFAAHVRYHWMENVVYWVFRYIPLTMLGADLVDIFGIHVVNLAWGHFNHTNVTVDTRITGGIVGTGVFALVTWLNAESTTWILAAIPVGAIAGAFILGPFMRKIFNSPEMHIWHHSWELPKDKPYGVNFGITLAIWDYIFGTAHVPSSGKDIALGFDGLEKFPESFIGQFAYGFAPEKSNSEGAEGVTQ